MQDIYINVKKNVEAERWRIFIKIFTQIFNWKNILFFEKIMTRWKLVCSHVGSWSQNWDFANFGTTFEMLSRSEARRRMNNKTNARSEASRQKPKTISKVRFALLTETFSMYDGNRRTSQQVRITTKRSIWWSPRNWQRWRSVVWELAS